MKIAFIYSSVFSHGGVQRVIVNIANELSKKHDIYLLLTSDFDIDNNYYGLNLEDIKIIGLNSFEYNKKSDRIRRVFWTTNVFFPLKNSKYIFRKKTRERLTGIINDQQFDIVISCSLLLNMLLGTIKNKVDSKLIGWEHNSFDSYFNNRKINKYSNYKKIAGYLLNQLDAVVTLTKHDQNKFKKEMELDSIVISNPIGLKKSEKNDCNNRRILIVGRLEHYKGTEFLVQIIQHFCSLNKEWNFKIVGEGPLENQLKDSISDNNLNRRVEIAKFTNEISSEYEVSDIYINTSRYESFGLTVLEAMQHGLPVITFNTAGPGELVETNFSGYVIDKYNIDDFVEKLDFLCGNDEARNKMSNNAMMRAQDFAIENIMMKWDELLFNCKEEGNF